MVAVLPAGATVMVAEVVDHDTVRFITRPSWSSTEAVTCWTAPRASRSTDGSEI